MVKNYAVDLHNLLKILTIICFISLSISLIIIWNNPINGYESSIYWSVPLYFWVILYASILLGITIVVLEIYQSRANKNFILIGLALIFFSFIVCLSLYKAHGYFSLNINGDGGWHVGFINEILSTGHITIIYPDSLTLTAILSYYSGLNTLDLYTFVPIYFNFLYILFIYYLSRTLFKDRGPVILSTILGCVILLGLHETSGWHLYYLPNSFANMILPLIIAVFIKCINNPKAWIIILTLSVIAFITYHPVSALAFIFCIISIFLYIVIYNNIIIKISPNTKLRNINSLIIVFFIVCFIVWISLFWRGELNKLSILFEGGGITHIDTLLTQVFNTHNSSYNLSEYIIKLLFGNIIFALITTISFVIIIIKTISRSSYTDNEMAYIKVLPSFYIAMFFMLLFTLFCYILNLDFSPLRFMENIYLLATFFCGLLITWTLIKARKLKSRVLSNMVQLIVIVVLTIVFINGIAILYPSPYILSDNSQTSASDISGMKWFIDNRDLQKTMISMSISAQSYLYYFSVNSTYSNNLYFGPMYYKIPYHFGNTSLSNYYDEDIYMLINTRDTLVYVNVVPQMQQSRFYPSDYDKVNWDPGVERLYNNGNINTYYIVSKK